MNKYSINMHHIDLVSPTLLCLAELDIKPYKSKANIKEIIKLMDSTCPQEARKLFYLSKMIENEELISTKWHKQGIDEIHIVSKDRILLNGYKIELNQITMGLEVKCGRNPDEVVIRSSNDIELHILDSVESQLRDLEILRVTYLKN